MVAILVFTFHGFMVSRFLITHILERYEINYRRGSKQTNDAQDGHDVSVSAMVCAMMSDKRRLLRASLLSKHSATHRQEYRIRRRRQSPTLNTRASQDHIKGLA